MVSRIAFITGITGQDGAYLCEFLLDRGYTVHGLLRRSSLCNTGRIANLRHERLHFHYGDMVDSANLVQILRDVRPGEIYNLAAQSHVQVSFEAPDYTANVNALGTLRLLEAVRVNGLEKNTKFYQASTSELYGKVVQSPQSETTPFHPRSPYGVSKLFAYWTVINYRESYGMFTCNGIMFNHESPRRGETFVSRKISKAVARICRNLGWGPFRDPKNLSGSDPENRIFLGNLEARRDWGHAVDYVRGMWKLLQHSEPMDCVFATGETHSVREFVQLAFQQVGRTLVWSGCGTEEKGIDEQSGRVLVEIDPRFYRPCEVDLLLGDASRAREILGWEPQWTFSGLVEEMVKSDLEAEKS